MWLQRRTRRTVLASLLAVGAMGVAGCGEGGDSDASSSAAAKGGAEGKTVIFSSCARSNAWCGPQIDTFTKPVKEAGADVKVLENPLDPAVQVQQLNQAIAEKPDVLVVHATDTKSVVPAIRKAEAAGISVVSIDGRAAPEAIPALEFQVLFDQEALGRFAAQNLVEGLQQEKKTSGRILAIKGNAGMYTTQDRMKGFNAVMEEHPDYEVVVRDGKWDPVQSGKIASQLFAQYRGQGGFVGAYGMADYMAIPIVEAAKQAGMEVGTADDGLVVTGSNCTKAGIAAIKAGEMYGTASQNPYSLGETLGKAVVDYLEGKEMPEIVDVPAGRVTQDTIGEYAELCDF